MARLLSLDMQACAMDGKARYGAARNAFDAFASEASDVLCITKPTSQEFKHRRCWSNGRLICKRRAAAPAPGQSMTALPEARDTATSLLLQEVPTAGGKSFNIHHLVQKRTAKSMPTAEQAGPKPRTQSRPLQRLIKLSVVRGG